MAQKTPTSCWLGVAVNIFENVQIVGVGGQAILQFENGATYILAGPKDDTSRYAAEPLQEMMRKLGETELRVAPITGDRTLPRELANEIDDIANLITSVGERDFTRLRDQAAQISQWSLVGDADFHALPWELLCSAQNRWLHNAPMVRRRLGIREAMPRVSDDEELRILFVTARPSVLDVPPRAVIEPLLRQVEDSAASHPRLTVLRTGTYADMKDRLQQQLAAGTPVHIVHLDLHGTIIADPESTSEAHGDDDKDAGSNHSEQTEGSKTPVVIFEREPDLEKGDRWVGGQVVKPHELASELRRAGVQVLVLNACRSASGDGGANFAFHVAESDIPAVIGIRRRITVDAASEFVAHFYKKLCATPTASMPVTNAMRQARNVTSWSHPLESTFPSLFITRSPVLPLRPSSSERFDQKLQQIATAEAYRPKPPPVGRALDERVVRAQVFRRPLANAPSSTGRLGPLQLFGWRGVGKTTFVKSLASHWLEADLADHIVWRDLRTESARSILQRASEGEDPMLLVNEFLRRDPRFKPQASNVVVVDHTELIPPGDFGHELWRQLAALGSLDNRVIVVGRHQPWAASFIRGESRRFTMRALDDQSAAGMLDGTTLQDRSTEIVELSGRVPDVLRWFVSKERRGDDISRCIHALDIVRPEAREDTIEAARDLFSFDEKPNGTGEGSAYFLGSVAVADLAPFGWLAGPAWLGTEDLDHLAPSIWKQLLCEGLITEVPLQNDPDESMYLPHPLLPWLGRVAGIHLGGEFGNNPERPQGFRPFPRRTYWGEDILV